MRAVGIAMIVGKIDLPVRHGARAVTSVTEHFAMRLV